VASLTILVWDILNNVTNGYRLVFRHRIGLPTMVYFLSRVSALCWVIVSLIFSNTPSIDCAAFGMTSVVLLIIAMTSTMSLCYLRVSAVWRWNRYIVGFFGVLWLTVVASNVTMVHSLKPIQVETYCTVVIVGGRLILAPYIVNVVNHTLVFSTITYGICKNTLRRDMTFSHGAMLMLGKSLPTFSKALLHDSQISYIIILGMTIFTLSWINNWPQATSAFRLAPMAPNVVLLAILNGRVHRNTKLGLYASQSNDPKSQPHVVLPGNYRSSMKPVPMAVTSVDGSRSDHSATKSESRGSLDFGMA